MKNKAPTPNPTIIDRVVSYFSPVAGLNRARARMVHSMLRQYDGAQPSRFSDGWIHPSTSGTTEAVAAGNALRDRARDLVRNNPYASRALSILVSADVGAGFGVQARTGTARRDRWLMDAWKTWAGSTDCDVEGRHDFAGLMAQAVSCLHESGEALIRFVPQPSGSPIPLRLQILEPDFLDASRDGKYAAGQIVGGIEFDNRGKRVGYHLFESHPGDNLGTMKSNLVRASEIVHLFEQKRPGQQRGVSSFAPVLLRLRDLDDYQQALLVRAKVEACLTAFVTADDSSDPATLGASSTENSQRFESIEPGMINYLKPGENVQFLNPSGSGAHVEYASAVLHAVAAGVGIQYHQLTGDLTAANYSSLRAGSLEFRRATTRRQWNTLVPAFSKIWTAFANAAIAAGTIPDGPIGAEWMPPRFDLIDPESDVKGEVAGIRAGIWTLEDAILRNGYNPTDVLDRIASTNATLDEKGIVLDSDPRKTTMSGQLQVVPVPSAPTRSTKKESVK